MAKSDPKEENGNGRKPADRISITIDPSLRKNMRIAAAVNDLTVGEWATKVLERAADKSVEEMMAEAEA